MLDLGSLNGLNHLRLHGDSRGRHVGTLRLSMLPVEPTMRGVRSEADRRLCRGLPHQRELRLLGLLRVLRLRGSVLRVHRRLGDRELLMVHREVLLVDLELGQALDAVWREGGRVPRALQHALASAAAHVDEAQFVLAAVSISKPLAQWLRANVLHFAFTFSHSACVLPRPPVANLT